MTKINYNLFILMFFFNEIMRNLILCYFFTNKIQKKNKCFGGKLIQKHKEKVEVWDN